MSKETQSSLFENNNEKPLSESSRPVEFKNFIGQKHFFNESFIKWILSDKWSGILFWGPPGTGKTTLARIISKVTQRKFEYHSAVTTTVKELRATIERSQTALSSGLSSYILFIDEVHRLNTAQQDVLLPFIEDGSIRFIGATTENPSFKVNQAICSRCLIFKFKPLETNELKQILKVALKNRNMKEEVFDALISTSLGDARRALNLLEYLLLTIPSDKEITLEEFKNMAHSQSLYYDKKSDHHYDTISAFIKSVRGSDPNAALYYLARMLEAGEDPLFISRRLMILASEDIGNANPLGLILAVGCHIGVQNIGMPEARILLSQTTSFLSCCEKSNRSYEGIEKALEEVSKSGSLEIPLTIRNAVTSLMKEMGYGKDYKYAHTSEDGHTAMTFLPEPIKTKKFYVPKNIGYEKKFLEYLQTLSNKVKQT